MKSRDISVGALIKVDDQQPFYVHEIKDGRVIFRRTMQDNRRGWWLPYAFVLGHGALIKPGEAGARPGMRSKP